MDFTTIIYFWIFIIPVFMGSVTFTMAHKKDFFHIAFWILTFILGTFCFSLQVIIKFKYWLLVSLMAFTVFYLISYIITEKERDIPNQFLKSIYCTASGFLTWILFDAVLSLLMSQIHLTDPKVHQTFVLYYMVTAIIISAIASFKLYNFLSSLLVLKTGNALRITLFLILGSLILFFLLLMLVRISGRTPLNKFIAQWFKLDEIGHFPFPFIFQ